MSAIYGVIPTGDIDVTVPLETLFTTYQTRYPSDRTRCTVEQGVGLGALEQWIRRSDQSVALPYRTGDIHLVVDAMLDYREALAQQVGYELTDTTSDCELIAAAYLKWGADCVEHLHGPFAFALYDATEQKLILVRDRLGERSLCYGQTATMFAFSTTAKPLGKLLNRSHDETFFEAYALSPFLPTGAAPYATPWQGVTHLGPGQRLTFQKGQVTIETYWTYTTQEKLVLADEQDYYDLFEKTLEAATHECLALEGEVGLMLSGGLDSTTVAAFAEPILKQRKQTLHGYTHVPLTGYEDDERLLGNERPLVEDLLSRYDGIDQTWVENPSKNSYNTIDEWLDIVEMPYGFFINAPWLLEIHQLAQEKGIKVILNGKHGNSTVSHGSLASYQYELLQQKHWRRFKEEAVSLKQEHWAPVVVGKSLLRTLLFPPLQENRLARFYNKQAKRAFRPERLQRVDYLFDQLPLRSTTDKLEFIYRSPDPHERGVISTLCSLHFNCIIRDPTSDRKLIDLCAQFPIELFSSNGIPKKIVRTIMKNRLPESILNPKRAKGRQSADWSLRLANEKQMIVEEAQACQTSFLTDMYQPDYFDAKTIEETLTDLWATKLLLRAFALKRFKGGEDDETRMVSTSTRGT